MRALAGRPGATSTINPTKSRREPWHTATSVDVRSQAFTTCAAAGCRLTDRELSERLTALPGWELVDGKLRHTFGFGSFDQSMKFVAKIAAIADKFNHHPDICVHNKRSVRLTCWTRQMHCLTRVDFDLAEAFSAVHDEQCSQQVAR